METLIAKVSNLTLQQLFENIIREAGVLSSIMLAEDKHWQLQVMMGLFEFIRMKHIVILISHSSNW